MFKRIIKTIPLLLMSFSLCACTFATSQKEEIANPWIEYATLNDAKESGLFLLPNAPSVLSNQTLSYIAILEDGNISEVQYGDQSIIIRKGFRQENVSGDYTEYPTTTIKSISNKRVTLKSATKDESDDERYNLAEWDEGLKYSCSIYSESGFTSKELKEMMTQIF